MTTKIIVKDEIRAHLLKVLSGYCFRDRNPNVPKITILSPWISDVQLELDKERFLLDDMWFGLDYGIISINLAYALLLLKVSFGAEIEIVTLPPTEKNYGNGAYYRQMLLDFLDEIGCNIYLNSDLHSKLIISNDSALLGSFNLSKSALYSREEIGVSFDDIGNLKILEKYATDVIAASIPFGTSPTLKVNYDGFDSGFYKLTRGKLFDAILKQFGPMGGSNFECHYVFTRDQMGLEGLYSKYLIQEIGSDIEKFFTEALLSYLTVRSEYAEKIDERKKFYLLREILGYKDEFDLKKIVQYVRKLYERNQIPKIPLKLKIMPPVNGEVTPKWASTNKFNP